VSMRDLILNSDDIPTELIDIPEWGVTIEVRGMTGADRASILESAMLPTGGVNLQAFYPEIIIACAHDPETGQRLFTSADRDAVMAKSGKAIDRLATAGLSLSGMTEAAQTQLGKDSSMTESADSTTN